VRQRQRSSLDGALQHVAALLQAGTRALDRVGRLDELTFVLISPLAQQSDHAVILNRLRGILTAAPVTLEEVSYAVEPVFSVVLVTPGSTTDAEAMMRLIEEGQSSATTEEPSISSV
jgi:PleD family two-component response regulator